MTARGFVLQGSEPVRDPFNFNRVSSSGMFIGVNGYSLGVDPPEPTINGLGKGPVVVYDGVVGRLGE